MFDPEEFRPGGSDNVFASEGDYAEAAQAAQLVVLAVTLGIPEADLRGPLLVEVPELAQETINLLPLPPLYLTDSWQLVDLIRDRLVGPLVGPPALWSSGAPGQEQLATLMQDSGFVQEAWNEVLRSRDPLTALAFVATHLWSPSSFLRAIAIASLTRVDSGLRFLETAALALLDGEDELRPLGEVALRNLRVEAVDSSPSQQPPPNELVMPSSPRSILMNGTFSGLASPADWFWPTSGTANHIRGATPSDLYEDETSFYRWGGSFSGPGRRAAAEQLDAWTKRRELDGLHMVFAHSHGGNVAFDYLQRGGAIELLVLLHTPIINRASSAWRAIAGNVGRVLVLSTKLDYVVWLDRAASLPTFRLPLVRSLESVLGGKAVTLSRAVNEAWLSHTHYTKEETWRRNNIAANVAYHHAETHPRS